MLKSLTIRNYALIDQLTIDFDKGFSVITGETGAGKSILLGALGLILGQRADSSVLMNPEEKCVVEGVFDISRYNLKVWMEANDLDYDAQTVIRREILSNGKSRAFVNDTPANLLVLKDFTSVLIDIHSQHQTLLLAENHFQMKVVDEVSQSFPLILEYRKVYDHYLELERKRARLVDEHQKQKSDQDYWQFQYQQLTDAQLRDGEQEELEQLLQQLTHAGEIKMNLAQVIDLLDNDNISVLGGLRDARTAIDKIAKYLDSGSEFYNRIQSAYLDLKDLSEELQNRADKVEHSADEIERTSQRLSLIYDLQQKHQVGNVVGLIEISADLKQKLDGIVNYESDLNNLETAILEARKQMTNCAGALTECRQKSIEGIENHLVQNLRLLGMPNAILKVEMTERHDFGPDGKDEINFLFTANKSGIPSPISKVASGGEMSRLMLCIKSLVASSKDLPTLILDEIDTGVSGEIAHHMGLIMQEMSQNCQLITITHLPQIAGKGHTHYKVFKVDDHQQTTSKIEKLSSDQRVVEIAKMLSGSELSDAAMRNARELLRN